MPYTIVMQDWVRIHGSGSSTITVQDEARWVDIGAFQGVTPWIQVGFFGGSPVLSLETAPTRDDVFFKKMEDPSGNASSWAITAGGLQTGGLGGTVIILSFNWADAVLPPAKWLRWKITGGSNWRAVFRITLTAFQGRGGALRHAVHPLPEDARRHPHDHAHAVQLALRARAAKLGAHAPVRSPHDADAVPGEAARAAAFEKAQLAQITGALLARLGPEESIDSMRTRSFVESELEAKGFAVPGTTEHYFLTLDEAKLQEIERSMTPAEVRSLRQDIAEWRERFTPLPEVSSCRS